MMHEVDADGDEDDDDNMTYLTMILGEKTLIITIK